MRAPPYAPFYAKLLQEVLQTEFRVHEVSYSEVRYSSPLPFLPPPLNATTLKKKSTKTKNKQRSVKGALGCFWGRG